MGETLNGAIIGPHGVINPLAPLGYCVHFHLADENAQFRNFAKINPKQCSAAERVATENESHLFIEWIIWCRLFASHRTTQFCNDRSQLFIFFVQQMYF